MEVPRWRRCCRCGGGGRLGGVRGFSGFLVRVCGGQGSLGFLLGILIFWLFSRLECLNGLLGVSTVFDSVGVGACCEI